MGDTLKYDAFVAIGLTESKAKETTKNTVLAEKLYSIILKVILILILILILIVIVIFILIVIIIILLLIVIVILC